jgi:proteasome lid subunit RPN8/RPN11
MSSTSRANAPDVRQLPRKDLADTPFPGGRNQDFRVYFAPEVHRRVWQHAAENPSVEICGVLVGRWARDGDGPFVLISECIAGEAAKNKFAEVTFTHETWAKINEQMDSRFATLAIVGWYHSHPDFGVFLSDRDLFIQEHFFAGPGQLAYVVDPIRKTEGVFLWREGKPTLANHYWVGDRIQVATAAGKETALAPPAARAALAPGNAVATSARERSGVLSMLSQVGLFLAVFILGYLVAGRLTDLERLHIEQNALARSWIFLKIRPGLREEMDLVNDDLKAAAQTTAALAREHLKLVEDPKEKEEQWNSVLRRLDRSTKILADLQTKYGLTPEESKLLKALGEIRGKALVVGEPKSEGTPTADDKPKGEAKATPEEKKADGKAPSDDKPRTENKPVPQDKSRAQENKAPTPKP